MIMNLTDKTVLITGGASGIGCAAVQAFWASRPMWLWRILMKRREKQWYEKKIMTKFALCANGHHRRRRLPARS